VVSSLAKPDEHRKQEYSVDTAELLEHRQKSREEADQNNQTVETENAINNNESSRVTLKVSESKVTLGKH
jgi:hypothetical protein